MFSAFPIFKYVVFVFALLEHREYSPYLDLGIRMSVAYERVRSYAIAQFSTPIDLLLRYVRSVESSLDSSGFFKFYVNRSGQVSVFDYYAIVRKSFADSYDFFLCHHYDDVLRSSLSRFVSDMRMLVSLLFQPFMELFGMRSLGHFDIVHAMVLSVMPIILITSVN